MKQHLRNIDYPLFIMIVILSCIGLVMVYSASFVYAGMNPDIDNPSFYFNRQRLWVILGLAVFLVVSLFSYRKLGNFIKLLIIATLVMLVLVLIPGVGVERNFSTRWLSLGPVLFQPSELAKVAMILYFAKVYTNKRNKLHHFGQGVLPPLLVLAFVGGLIVLQPDLGTAASIILACGMILLFAGIRIHHLLFLGTTAVVGVVLLILGADYRMGRFTSFLDPFADPAGDGYQLIHSLIAIANGQVTGVGLANSVQKSGFLPEAHTDFIMSIIAEELGLIGAVAVISIYFVFMFKGILIAKRAPDGFGRLLAFGITFQIVTQAMINFAAVSGLMPITGITLPLISYGGSSMLITFFLLGVLMNIAIKGNISRREGTN
ncbi:cell division protein FtsW [Alkalibacillus filiformis]|uniref:Probable peptidoglycan glycosyltransferase FtsW n=1 Tax=Alkalibacillus filiformis TaxID=200990 RepID=A0ABU0DWD5_9BACI|nr:cell division protein FtsW [Alkalibacillus filiformis]